MPFIDYKEEAQQLLESHRKSVEAADAAAAGGSKRGNRKNPKDGNYTYKEVNSVLHQAIDEEKPAELIRALLSLGADVNNTRRVSSNLWKKVTRKDQEAERSDILQRAAKRSPAPVVGALAECADQENLDDALHHAILRGDLAVVRVLLANGADPEPLHDDFEQAVLRGDKDLVSVMLSSAKLPCLSCRSSGLAVAVRKGDTDILKALVGRSSNVNFNRGAALLLAIKAERTDFVSVLVSGPVTASPETLDFAVGTAWTALARKDSSQGGRIIDTLLAAGATGPATEKMLTDGLVEVVRQQQTSLLDIFLKHTSPIDPHHTQALVAAIEAYQDDVLEKLLRFRPSEAALATALRHAMAVKDSPTRLAFVQIVLSAGARGRAVAEALINATRLQAKAQATKTADDEMELLDILLVQGKADVNYNNGEALCIAIRTSLDKVAWKIFESQPSQSTLEAALCVAIQLEDRAQKLLFTDMLLASGLQGPVVDQCLVDVVKKGFEATELIQSLLTRASVNFNEGEALCCAIQNQDETAFRLILAERPDELAISSALKVSLALPKAERRTYYIELLPQFQEGHLDRALHHLVDEPTPDLVLLGLTLEAGPTVESASSAFASAVHAGHIDDYLVHIIEVFATEKLEAIVSYTSAEGAGPVQLVLARYPNSVSLVKQLYDIGCDFERCSTQEVFQYDNRHDHEVNHENFGEERVSVLLWAILRPAPFITGAVVREIIDMGANVNFTTDQSKTSPLIAAAKQGQPDTVQVLLGAGAKCSARDALGRSALFYAARIGDEESVAMLIKKRATVDDGSLHEAARGFHVDVMDQLLDAGHEPNYRSTKHDGRTVLGEVALHGAVPGDMGTAEAALNMLKPAADPLVQVHGKSVIFLALDNQQDAEAMTKLLLDRILWKSINDTANVYQDGELHYSPTMYVKKGIFRGSRAQSGALLRLLKGQGATDRYYATIEHTQPPDAVGLPDEIRDFEKEKRAWNLRRQRDEDDHQTQLRRQAEEAAQRIKIADGEHHAQLTRAEDTSAQRRRHRGLDHTQDVQLAAEKHHAAAGIARSEAQNKSAIEWMRHRDARDMREDRFAQGARHRQASASARALEDESRHNMNLRMLEDRHAQSARMAREQADLHQATRQRQLEFAEREGAARLLMHRQHNEEEARHMGDRDAIAARREDRQLRALAAAGHADKDRHNMRMTEMEAERMKMVGDVNLAEWKAWKSGQVVHGLESGGGGGGGRRMIEEAGGGGGAPRVEEVDDDEA